jgi:hypothetical protein
LTQPFEGRQPEAHGCGQSDCVVCPRCGEPLCAVSKRKKAEKIAELKGLITPVPSSDAQPRHAVPATIQRPGAAEVPLPAVEPFPAEVLPAILARFVAEGSVALGCPPDFLGVPMLAIGGLAIGQTRTIEVKPGWEESASLYAAIIGSPGSTKTPALKQVVEPVERIQLEWEEDYIREVGGLDLEREQAAFGEPESDDHEEPPTLRRCLTTDATCEAFATLLADNPRGIGLIRDEIVAWTKSMNMYRKGKGGDREFYMSAHSGTAIWIDRKGNAGGMPIRIPKPFVTVCGGLVPDLLGELADDEGRADGFLDRILFSYPDPPPVAQWTEAIISPEAREGWEDALRKLFDLEIIAEPGEQRPSTLPMAAEAKEVFRDFFNSWEIETRVRGPLAGTWSKLKGYCARLALILQLLRWACGEAEDSCVDEVSMRGAVTLTHYFASQAERVRAAMGSKPDASDAGDGAEGKLLETLLRLVSSGGGRWDGTATDLLDSLLGSIDAETSDDPHWPRNADSLGRLLRRKAAEWGRRLIIVLTRAADRNRTRLISLEEVSEVSKCPIGATQEPREPPRVGPHPSSGAGGVSAPQPLNSQQLTASGGHLDTSDSSGKASQHPEAGGGSRTEDLQGSQSDAQDDWEEGTL